MDFGYYAVLKIIHIVTIVVGIGTVSLNGIYGAKAKAAGRNGGVAIGRANYDVSKVAEYFIYAIPVTGILMVIDHDFWDWDQTWVWLSIALYVVALGISHAIQIPSARRMNELMAAGPPNDETASLEKKLGAGGMTLNLIALAIIVLMVWKPGL